MKEFFWLVRVLFKSSRRKCKPQGSFEGFYMQLWFFHLCSFVFFVLLLGHIVRGSMLRPPCREAASNWRARAFCCGPLAPLVLSPEPEEIQQEAWWDRLLLECQNIDRVFFEMKSQQKVSIHTHLWL